MLALESSRRRRLLRLKTMSQFRGAQVVIIGVVVRRTMCSMLDL